MRSATMIIAGLMCLAASAGCSADRPAAAQLQGKFDAALALQDEARRDDALASVASEAAEGTRDLDPSFARECAEEAVKEIKDPRKKDDTAAKCATSLARRGHYSEATIIAKLIADVEKRDATLAAISKR